MMAMNRLVYVSHLLYKLHLWKNQQLLKQVNGFLFDFVASKLHIPWDNSRYVCHGLNRNHLLMSGQLLWTRSGESIL